MARKTVKKKAAEERGFSGMFAGTVVLGIVFSAGLITGQRLLRAEARAPMVSLSTTTHAPAPAESEDEGKPSLRTTFSFYDHLTSDAQAVPAPTLTAPAEAAVPAVEKPASPQPAAKPVEAAKKPVEAAKKPVEAAKKPATVETKPVEPAPAPVSVKTAEKNSTVTTILDDVVDSLAGGEAEKQPAAALPARYTLQVSSHPDRNSAEQELGRLRGVGVDPHIVVVDVPGKGKLWRVRVGKFHSMDEARDFQGSMKARRGVAGFVTPL